MSSRCPLRPGTAGTASGLIITQGRGTQARAGCVIAYVCVPIPAPAAAPKVLPGQEPAGDGSLRPLLEDGDEGGPRARPRACLLPPTSQALCLQRKV